jgi:hypothetical protein
MPSRSVRICAGSVRACQASAVYLTWSLRPQEQGCICRLQIDEADTGLISRRPSSDLGFAGAVTLGQTMGASSARWIK